MNIILVLQLAKDGFDIIHNWCFQTKDIEMQNVVHFRFSKKAEQDISVGLKFCLYISNHMGDFVKCL